MAKESIKDVKEVTSEQVAGAIKPIEEAGTDTVVVQPVEEVRTGIKQKIYVGPNLLGLPTYTVIEDDFTVHINSFIEKCPEIKKMFVPIAEMANTEKRAKEKGTLEHRHYQKVMSFKNAVREGDQ